MELIISLAMKFWMWTILIIVVILGSLINLLDKKKPRCYTFTSKKMPVLRPIASLSRKGTDIGPKNGRAGGVGTLVASTQKNKKKKK